MGGGGFYNVIGLAGRGLSDYTGIIALPEYEAEAIAAFSRYLRRSNWATLSLEFFRASPNRVERLLRCLPPKSFRRTEIPAVNKGDNINNCICAMLGFDLAFPSKSESASPTRPRSTESLSDSGPPTPRLTLA